MAKISVSSTEKVMKENYTPVVTEDWYGNELTIKTMLSLREMFEFVKVVVDGCFNQDTHEYLPEAKEFVLRASIVEYYTNVRMPDNLERRYAILYGTDLVDFIISRVNKRQFEDMNVAIEKKIKNRVRSNEEMVSRQFITLGVRIDEIMSRFEEVFSGVTKEEITGFLSAVSNGQIDEEKIVKLSLEQSHKENAE